METEKKQSKAVIILLGPPGSGKGTQGTLLAEKFGLYYFETSRILEESFRSKEQEEFIEIDGEKYSPRREKEENWEKGNLCSPPFVAYLINKKIGELSKEGKGMIMSGSPRTLYEGEKIIPLLCAAFGLGNIKVILIEISPENTISRNSHRRICGLMRHPILYSNETKNLEHCPLDGSKLMRREGLDDPETIKIRLKEYDDRTLPLVEYFEKQGLKVAKINGEQPVAEVYEDILKALE